MMMPQTPELIEEVKALRDTINTAQSRITRQNIIIAVLVLAVIGVGYNTYQINQIQKTNCENGNITRSVNRDVWTVVLSASEADSEQEAIVRETFKQYVLAAYADRDCDDLSKEYVPPAKPDLSKLRGENDGG